MSSSVLKAEEIAFLDKIKKQNEKHREAQARYRETKHDDIKAFNQKYHEEKRKNYKILIRNC